MNTDGASVPAGNEQASCGQQIGSAGVGRSKIDIPINIDRHMQHVHFFGKPGSGKAGLLERMLLKAIESGAGVVHDGCAGTVAKLEKCLDDQALSPVVHLTPTDYETSEPSV